MRIKLHVLLAAASLLAIGTWASAQSGTASKPESASLLGLAAASGDFIGLTVKDDGGKERVVLIDSRERSIAVYGISAEAGELELLSSRNVADDMSVDVFNGKGLLPKDIRAMKKLQTR